MRLRSSKTLPQAGTRNGESRPGHLTPGSPTYSGGGTVSLGPAQSRTVADREINTQPPYTSHLSSPTSSSYNFFQSPSSTSSYHPIYSPPSRSTSTSPTSCDVVQEAHAYYPAPITDIINPMHKSKTTSTTHCVDNITHTHTTDINTPVRSVLQEMLPATTLAGKSRQRMKWTDQINRELLRCYYIVTNCEDNLTAFRPLLYKKFTETLPELSHLTEQRLADQIRVIHRNNRISAPEREIIKQKVSQRSTVTDNLTNSDIQEMHLHPKSNQSQDIPTQHLYTAETAAIHTSHIPTHQTHTIITSQIGTETLHHAGLIGQENTYEHSLMQDTETSVSSQEVATYMKIKSTFNELIIKYTGTDPTLRPLIPKSQTTPKFIKTVNTINEIIKIHLQQKKVGTLEELHEVIYCAALTVSAINTEQIKNKNHIKPNSSDNMSKNKQKLPQWQKRLENKVAIYRKIIGKLTQYLSGNLSLKKQRNLNPNNKSRDQIVEELDANKQKLQAYSKRLHRYKISNKRKSDNILFNANQKLFYQNLNAERIDITDPPNIAEVQQYWQNLWSKPAYHNPQASWATMEEQDVQIINPMPVISINKRDVTHAIKNTLNWKAPGPDKIQNYWLKYFTSTHQHLANTFNHIIHNPQDMPSFLTQGITYLKPKDKDTSNPEKYRPITCLPTTYKLLTSILSHKLNSHLTHNKIIQEEQKGCSKGSMGCKEQLVIDTELHNQVKHKHRNLYYTYIDYKKAFDSVPHSWLLHVLRIYKIDNILIQFLQQAMTNWNTKLHIRTNKTSFNTESIKIARGIFQGDSLSPLWFCLALNPLSKILNKTDCGYIIDKVNSIKVTHLFYMDDIKLYAANRQQLDHLIKVTEEFSTDIKMMFGIDKCRINSIIKGQYKNTNPYQLKLQTGTIESMDPKESYKYLGYQQSTGINHTEIKTTLKNKYKHRLKTILSTQLSARNKTKAINTYAIPVLTYSFGIVKWSDTELDALNTITRTVCNKHNYHHIHSAIQRFTLKRKHGGRGFIDIKNLHHSQIDNLRSYFYTKAEESSLHKVITNLPHSGTSLQLNNRLFDPKQSIINDKQKLECWKKKALHGKYPHQIDQEHIDQYSSCTWLTKGNIFGETEGFMIAIQDQIIKTRNYARYILKETLETDKCRLCHQASETIDHITGGCNTLANKEYTHRHDNIAKHIHQQLALKYNLLDTYTPYYKYRPKNVIENSTVKLYWDRSIVTDRTILSNRPDITLTLKSTKTTYLIDIAVPNTHNLKQKHTEKIQKYIPLADEIKQMWHQEAVKIIPIIISSTGVIPKTLKSALKLLELPQNTYVPMQKSIVIDTCSIVRRFLNPTSLPILSNNNTNNTKTTSQNDYTHLFNTQRVPHGTHNIT